MQRWSRQVSCSMLSQSYSANMVVGDDGISTSWRAFDENPIFCVFSPPPWPVFEVPLQVVLKVVAACVPSGAARGGYSRMDRNCHRPWSLSLPRLQPGKARRHQKSISTFPRGPYLPR